MNFTGRFVLINTAPRDTPVDGGPRSGFLFTLSQFLTEIFMALIMRLQRRYHHDGILEI